MSDRRVKAIEIHKRYYEFSKTAPAFLRGIIAESTIVHPSRSRVVGLAQKVVSLIESLPAVSQEKFDEKKLIAEGFLSGYGPMPKDTPVASPETRQRMYEQICGIGAYSPV